MIKKKLQKVEIQIFLGHCLYRKKIVFFLVRVRIEYP